MRITVGAPPLGQDFYEGRQIVVEELRSKLERNDVIVVGPRRTGKTCTIQEYLRQEGEKNSQYRGVYVDLQTAQSLYEFYLRIIKKVVNTANKWKGVAFDFSETLRNLSTSLSEILNIKADLGPYLGTDADISLNFKLPSFEPHLVEELAKKLKELLEGLNINITLVLDEFPELIWKLGKDKKLEDQKAERKMMTEHLLGGLRALRQEGGEARKYRIVIAGSVNLYSTLEHLDLSTLVNDVEHLKIPYLQRKQSIDLFEKLADTEEFKFKSRKEVKSFIEKQFGECSPYYIQFYADILRQEKISSMGKATFTDGLLKKCYKDLLTDKRGPRTLKLRVEKYYGKDSGVIKEILRIVSSVQFETGKGVNENELYNDVKDHIGKREHFNENIAKLKCDGLIFSLDGDSLGFKSQLICNSWNYTLGDTGKYLI